jgi:hypothetical protein
VGLIKSAAFSVSTSELQLWKQGIEEVVLPLKKAHSELAALGKTDYLEEIAEEMLQNEMKFNSLLEGKRLMFYGAGNKCRELLMYFTELGLDFPEQIWDRAAKPGRHMYNVPIVMPDFASVADREDIVFVITIESNTVSKQVWQQFNEAGFYNILTYREIIKSLSRKLWHKLENERIGF